MEFGLDVHPVVPRGSWRDSEQLRYQAAGEWGNLLDLDRVPEVRTLREKVNYCVRN